MVNDVGKQRKPQLKVNKEGCKNEDTHFNSIEPKETHDEYLTQ